ncbi:MAG: hypothetical protein KZQ60_00335 [Candidatus Thiodiazotropha sp. (ex Lucinoma aequizonata)]|nr:hypothetical protein [Candidatus Thiodiazotropha sp. (ex Lucinoma aequizonata)]
MHYSIMTTAMTLRRLGCALCMPFISPFRSPFRPYNRAYAYRGLTAFAPLSMAVSVRRSIASQLPQVQQYRWGKTCMVNPSVTDQAAAPAIARCPCHLPR